MKKILLFILILLPLCVVAQKQYSYSGQKIFFKENTLKCSWIAKLQGVPNQSYQGMDIWGNCMVSLQNTGVATIYDFDGKHLKKKGSFNLASHHETNHANVASFSNIFYDKHDKLPLLYISRCNGTLLNGMDKLFFVERIDANSLKSQLVQKVWLNDYKHNFGGYALGAVDRQNNMLYMFAETTGHNDAKNNKHWILKFRLPVYRGPQDSLVVLTEDDALDKFYLEDNYKFDHQPTTQGGCVKNGLLFLSWGVGKKKNPSILYVINLAAHSVQNVINLQKAVPHEFEDCTEYKGDMIIQTQGDLYKIIF